MDSYQAIYDAVRSKISTFDGNQLTERIAQNFDFSMQIEIVKQEFMGVALEMQRPSILLKPKVYIDGDQWCALYGEDLQEGICGFGDSPSQAMDSFDTEYNKPLAAIPKEAI